MKPVQAVRKITKGAQALEIQGSLKCNHCESVFSGTLSQAKKLVYEGRKPYCSDICRKASMSERFSTPVPKRGPCINCGDEFFSRREVKFCGMKCYTGSTQFSDMLKDARAKSMTPESIEKRAASARTGNVVPCLECGEDVYQKNTRGKKYCGKVCYRAYMAKRFDRQIANPDRICLPQGYDAFLDRDELPCPIDGCEWHGQWLSIHINQAHGITAEEFKRAAGFNKTSALVGKDLATLLSERESRGVALLPEYWATKGDSFPRWVRTKSSNEAKEHRAKSRAMLCMDPGPMRVCNGCGGSFQQSTRLGMAKYCTRKCRDATYASADTEKRLNAAKERRPTGMVDPAGFNDWNKSLKGAYIKGYTAREEGVDLSDCPYKDDRAVTGKKRWGKAFKAAWMEGYKDSTEAKGKHYSSDER